MAETKKITKREAINELLKEDLIQDTPMYKEYLEHELELLDRKNASAKGNSSNEENEKIKEILIEELAKVGKPITITDLMSQSEVIKTMTFGKENKPLSNQKISSILNRTTDERIVKVPDKKKTYFTVKSE